jgi:F-type H+-transporting ATPase subunit c
MAKKIPLLAAIVLFLMFVASQAFAQTGGAVQLSEKSVKYIAYFFALGIAVFGGVTAQSKAASVALEGIARNPSAADKIQTPMILGLALMESLVIFALISTFLLA